MDRNLNIVRREAQKAMDQRAMVRMGILSAYDPNNYAAKVRLQPEDVETGWLPIHSPAAGNGYGFFFGPTPGDVVEVHFQEGGKGAGFVGLRQFGDVNRPVPVQSGEFMVIHPSGSTFRLTNDGKSTVADSSGASFTLNADGSATLDADLLVNGDIRATGDITDLNDGSGSLNSLRQAYDVHRHGNVQNGGGVTATTDHPV